MEQRVLRRRFSPFCTVESGTRASQRKPRHPSNDDEIGMFIVIARTLLRPTGDVRRPATLPLHALSLWSTDFFSHPRYIGRESFRTAVSPSIFPPAPLHLASLQLISESCRFLKRGSKNPQEQQDYLLSSELEKF